MDRRGSIVMAVNHKTYLEMKELSVKLHGKKRDCLASGFVSKLSGVIYPNIPEIKLKELKTIWEHWMEERQNTFMAKYGDIALLLLIEVDEQLLKDLILFWNSFYWCFTFNQWKNMQLCSEYHCQTRIKSSGKRARRFRSERSWHK